MNLTLSVLPSTFAICRLTPESPFPSWAQAGGFLSLTRTDDELSIVCAQAAVPEDVKSDRGWSCLKLEGPLDLSLTGVLSSLLAPLAEARIGIFAVSTFDTDYLLVKTENLARSMEVLIQAGHNVKAP
jgi:hypothetical protein